MIEYQREIQIKAIEDNKKQLCNKKEQGSNDLLLSKEREIFKNIYNRRLDKIDQLTKNYEYDDLKFIVNSSYLDTDFGEFS